MTRTAAFIFAALGLATAALAHTGVQNPAVMARMDVMSAIGDSMKVLGTMAKGEAAFDADRAKEASLAIARHAAETPALFKAPEDDPMSEALPKIWETFDDFTAKSEALEAIAMELSGSMTTLDDVRTGVAKLGAACKACHADYRE